jgi:hypothetical protein
LISVGSPAQRVVMRAASSSGPGSGRRSDVVTSGDSCSERLVGSMTSPASGISESGSRLRFAVRVSFGSPGSSGTAPPRPYSCRSLGEFDGRSFPDIEPKLDQLVRGAVVAGLGAAGQPFPVSACGQKRGKLVGGIPVASVGAAGQALDVSALRQAVRQHPGGVPVAGVGAAG